MKKVASKYVNPDTKEEMVSVEINVDEMDEETEYLVQRATEQLVEYVLMLKGVISPPKCSSCCGGGCDKEKADG